MSIEGLQKESEVKRFGGNNPEFEVLEKGKKLKFSSVQFTSVTQSLFCWL